MKIYALLLLLLPGTLWASNDDPLTDTLPGPHKYRIGLSYAYERQPDNYYVAHRGEPVAGLNRGVLLALNMERYLTDLNHNLALWVRADASYQRMAFNGGYHRLTFRAIMPASMAEFYEEIEYDAFMLSSGLSLEPAKPTKFGPYLMVSAVLAVPTRLEYNFGQNEITSEVPGFRYVTGGARSSLGWTAEAGLRILPCKRVCLKLGGYVIDQNLRADWPPLEGRELNGVVMALRDLGMKVTAQYTW